MDLCKDYWLTAVFAVSLFQRDAKGNRYIASNAQLVLEKHDHEVLKRYRWRHLSLSNTTFWRPL